LKLPIPTPIATSWMPVSVPSRIRARIVSASVGPTFATPSEARITRLTPPATKLSRARS
jgi:hypothetical protein